MRLYRVDTGGVIREYVTMTLTEQLELKDQIVKNNWKVLATGKLTVDNEIVWTIWE